jgi:dTDP-4-amino-4,6-dideoxygalactose transaminase
VAAFERAFATTLRLPHAVGVANGTDAIALALRALGIGRGDKVLVPAVSAYPTTVGVLQAEATPSFVDVDTHGLMDVDAVERALEPGVRAILSVHLFGNCANLVRLAALAKSKGVLLIEDCAQAHGASRDGIVAGAAGHAASWSFYPTKNLGALGDAGAVTCAEEALTERLTRLRNYGQRTRYEHVERGFNSRLDPLQAAVLAARLPYLESENQRRRDIGQLYDEAFANLGRLRPVRVPAGAVPNRHLYPVLLPGPDQRSDLQAFLANDGVESLIHYPIAMPDQAASDRAWSDGREFPVARDFCQRVLSLPCHPELSDTQVQIVINTARTWAERGS